MMLHLPVWLLMVTDMTISYGTLFFSLIYFSNFFMDPSIDSDDLICDDGG